NGQVVKLFDTAHIPPDTINLFCGEEFGKLVNAKSATHAAAHSSTPVLEVHNLCFGAIQGLDFTVAHGECVVIQDMDNSILQDSLRLLTCEQRPVRGEISVNHIPFTKRSRRSIAVIQEMATETMLFSSMSYIDNLCFTMDHRLPSVWRRRRLKTSIRREYTQRLGSDIFDKHVDELSEREKYDLIYARIQLQRPDVVFCVQPFMQAGAELRVHIWKLLETFLEKGIAVVILAVNLADALSLADRLVTVQEGSVYRTYDRSEFGVLPAIRQPVG
ncbi:MAG: sugar ABC transporter ATP-binding protein, partial [Eubacteriales bacterium]|nr:sugar ABC transporter ATP-binding protein [Eubacteriales bacterium]